MTLVSIYDVKKNERIGTGVFISPRAILTCQHVIARTRSIEVEIKFEGKRIFLTAKKIYSNTKLDFSILEVNEEHPHFVLGDSSKLDYTKSYTVECPHEKRKVFRQQLLQSIPLFDDPKENFSITLLGDALPLGTSGSPLLNDAREIVGLHWGGGTTSRNKKYGFAIPINMIKSKLHKKTTPKDVGQIPPGSC